MPNIQVNHVSLYYEIHGAGEPLMLVAGLGSDSQSWQPIIEELSQHFLLITPDNRGTGRTVPQDAETSIQQIADDCMALASYLGFSSFNLLGHSMGGFVALDLAARYPDTVDRLILASTSTSNSKCNDVLFANWVSTLESGMDTIEWFRSIFYWLFTEHFFENENAVDAALHYAVDYPHPQSAVAFRKQVEVIAGFDCFEQLSEITAKTLVISGQEDILFPPDVSVSLVQAIPGAAFSVIAHAAHSIHMEQPQVFTECVLDFLLSKKMADRKGGHQ
ncbi:MAG: alpha/beta fold hydrolase [Campylobacterota bacterium]|nr:alpha/beta fold hydrolase [Campylobacterota bacterium]